MSITLITKLRKRNKKRKWRRKDSRRQVNLENKIITYGRQKICEYCYNNDCKHVQSKTLFANNTFRHCYALIKREKKPNSQFEACLRCAKGPKQMPERLEESPMASNTQTSSTVLLGSSTKEATVAMTDGTTSKVPELRTDNEKRHQSLTRRISTSRESAI